MDKRFSEAKRLHQKDEPLLPAGHLYSMLDLMGAVATCDNCEAWQRIPALSPETAYKEAAALGWKRTDDGKDFCPHCNPDQPTDKR